MFPDRTLLSPPLKLFLVLRWFYLVSSSEYLKKIQSILKNNSTVLPLHSAVPTLKPDQIPSSLSSCSHVFIREDSSKLSLYLLYRGPYLVLSWTPKYFIVQISSKSDSVFVDRLKPVFSDQPVFSQQPSRRGRPPSAPLPLTDSADSSFTDSSSFYSKLSSTSPESQEDEEASSVLSSTFYSSPSSWEPSKRSPK